MQAFYDVFRILSVYDVETCVLAQAFGYDNAFRRLVILKDCRHNARQGESRTIKGVAKASLLVFGAIAALQAVGLVSLKVRHR